MTPKQEAALRLALEALEYIYEGANNQGPHTGISWRCVSNKAEPAITALREALANEALDKKAENARELGLDYEPIQCPICKAEDSPYPKCGCVTYVEQPAQQEPVEWGVDWGRAGDQSCVSIIKRLPGGGIEVLATEYGPPASKPWVGLTQQDIDIAFDDTQEGGGFNEFARAIEQRLKEKNT